MVVSPDAGGIERARAMAKRVDSSLAMIDKRRSAPNEAHVIRVVGEVEGKDCIIVDDIVDTAGTLTKAAEVRLSPRTRISTAPVSDNGVTYTDTNMRRIYDPSLGAKSSRRSARVLLLCTPRPFWSCYRPNQRKSDRQAPRYRFHPTK